MPLPPIFWNGIAHASIGASSPNPSGSPVLPYQNVTRPTPYRNWCWAAVARGIAEFYGSASHSQCDIATQALGAVNKVAAGTDCCDWANRAVCNVQYALDAALQVHGNRNGAPQAVTINPPWPSALLAQEIAAKHVLGVRVWWNGSQLASNRGSHFVVLHGYAQHPKEFVFVSDPNPHAGIVGQRMPLRQLASCYDQIGNWTHLYLTKP